MLRTSESLRADFRYFYRDELPFLKSLPDMVDHSPCTVVNVGAGAGTSGLAFLECRDDLVLHTVDIQDDDSPFGCLYAEREVVKAAGLAHLWGVRWFQWHMDSKVLAMHWHGAPVGVCLIDGDHTYEGCTSDILGWLPHIRAGGILAVHDYRKGELPLHPDGPHPLVWEGVDQAVDELLIGKYSIIERVDSLIAFRVGEIMESKISETTEYDVADALNLAWNRMKDFKPNDRGDIDRRVAICITELEKLIAYWDRWVVMHAGDK